MSESQWILAEDRAGHPGQLVLGADPDLHEHTVAGVGHHIGRGATDHARLPDVERELEPLGNIAIRVSDDYVGKRKVDRGPLVGRLERGVDGGRRLRDGEEAFGR